MPFRPDAAVITGVLSAIPTFATCLAAFSAPWPDRLMCEGSCCYGKWSPMGGQGQAERNRKERLV